MHERRASSWALVALAVAAALTPRVTPAQAPGAAAPAGAAGGNDRRVAVRLGEQVARDDNLYRLPDAADPSLVLGPDASRDDSIHTTSLALLGRWMQARQEVVLDAALAANRFAENADLDYTSGHGALDWSWEAGRKWSGLLEARYEQTLASFANTRSLEKDVFTTGGYRGELNFEIGPRWRVIGGEHVARTQHDNENRRGDDADLEDTSLGVEYRTPRGSSLGWEYKRSSATYPLAVIAGAGGSASDYEDQRATMKLGYEPTEKVALKATFGYVERAYLHAEGGDFSGDVWSLAVQWTPTTKVQLAVESWRDLKAYLDAESNHFVSTGESLVAAWLPVAAIAVSVQISHEEQDYIGAGQDPLLLLLGSREDKPTTESVTVTYKLRDRATFNVSYRSEARESNTLRFDYDAATVSVGAEVKF
jgi:exopolysaccharide biosynthesis operon protein EpsL